MSNGLIELGEISRSREAPVPAVEPPGSYRALLGALSILLVVLLGGGLHRGPQEPPTVIPARLGDAVQLDGPRMFVVSAGRPPLGTGVENRIVSTYALPEVRLVARTAVSVSGEIMGIQQVGETLLVTYVVQTSGWPALVALTPGDDRPLWRWTGRLIGASAVDRLAVFATADAELGVDLLSGAVRWSVPRRRDGYVAAAGVLDGFPRWLVNVDNGGRLETRDARTGRLIATAGVAPVTGRTARLLWPTGDLVLLDTGGSGFAAYRLPGLTLLWHTPADLSHSWTQTECGDIVCVFGRQGGMTALDPATGRELWSSDRWVFAESAGPYLLATDESREELPRIWVLDPATGRELGDFGVWQPLGPSLGDGPAYGMWQAPGRYLIYYGVLDPATRQVRILGSGQRVSSGCETSAGVLVCRLIDASIAVWRLG